LVLAYALGLPLLAWAMLRLASKSETAAESRRMAKALAAAVIAIALCQIFTSEINTALNALGLPIRQASALDRFMDGGFGARRWIEWQKAWSVFVAHPLFGVGLGGYAAQSVLLEPAFAGQWSESWLFTHCHNIVLQLLAETGIVGTLAVATGLLWAFLPWFKRENAGADALLVLGLALVLLGHSLLEYPLWYASFLMVFAVLLGLTPARGFAVAIRPSLRRLGSLLLLGLAGWQIVLGLVMYFDWVRWVMPADKPAENKARIEALLQQGANPVWSYETDQLLSNYLDGSANHLALKLPLFERLAAYRPYPGTLVKLAMLRAHHGDAAGAEAALRQAIAAFPDTAPQLAAMLSAQAAPALQPLQQISRSAAQAYSQSGASAAAQTVK
ncbi:Wzy polymerase domain-containing protein, partial [Craterilacuibacter sp.]|uniref:PglL family O-oligosaccharyltransferase n=1 Tax=Craterilacuibacter sp. TaxID=2870909 RepID=UPI003F39E18A